MVIALGREIFGRTQGIVGDLRKRARAFGRRKLVDLVALMGNYAATAALLTAFDMQLDPGAAPGLPAIDTK